MLSLYFIFAVIFGVLAYVAIQKTENDGANLIPSQYLAVAVCGLFWPILVILLIIDFWSNKDDEKDSDEENNVE